MTTARLSILYGLPAPIIDRVLRHAASNCLHPARLRVARRAITRGPQADQHFESVSERQFNKRAVSGAFAFWWLEAGCGCGVPTMIDHWLAHGCSVLVHGSPAAAVAARRYDPGCRLIDLAGAQVDIAALGRRVLAQVDGERLPLAV